jgi:hypothetical protein
MGGKAQGLGFLSSQLQLFDIAAEFSPHRILVPDTTVLASDEFDRFVHDNKLDKLAGQDDQTVRQGFLDAPLAADVEATLRRFVLQHRCPLAVRSSSLSEDALDHPFAGVYLTYMLANNAAHVDVRTNQLSQAVRLVWAHVFCREPISYMRAHGIDASEEKMAVVLQEVVGGEQGGVFYPLCSGVAQSYNFFPLGRQAAEDGVAAIVLGLGKRAVDDEDALRFSPRHPTVRPDAARPQDLLHTTQKGFYAVDLSSGERELTGCDLDTLKELNVAEAESHGTLKNLASTWVAEDQTLYDGTGRRGRRVLTFNRLLRGELFPLPDVLSRLLHVVADGFGRPVELEFALTLDETPEGPRGTFHLLQARPMGSLSEETLDELPTMADERVLLTSSHAMGHRHLGQIRDILFVEPQGFNQNVAYEAARDIARLNDQLVQAGRPYVLIVPGRLGTRNAALGVPVTFAQVAGAAALVELSTCDFATEPSQGTHFFHNMVSRGMPFVSVDTNGGDGFHQDWLGRQPGTRHGALLHVTPDPPLALRVVGTTQQAIAYQQESDDE